MQDLSSTRRLRAVTGPLRGTTYVLDDVRLSIGRAVETDIHVMDGAVSRQHALVVAEGPERHVLVDLRSTNGTFVEGERIGRHPLELGTMFSVAGHTFVYEVTPPRVEVEVGADVGADGREVDGPMLRRTVLCSSVMDEPAANGPTPTATTRVQGPVEPPFRWYVPATRADGSTYEGSLVDDIVDYRQLWAHRVRGALLRTRFRSMLVDLDARLRRDAADQGAPPRGGFARFSCEFEAQLRVGTGPQWSCEVVELGLEGARVRCEHGPLRPGTIAELTIARQAAGSPDTVALSCWIGPRTDGLVELSFPKGAHTSSGSYRHVDRVNPGP